MGTTSREDRPVRNNTKAIVGELSSGERGL